MCRSSCNYYISSFNSESTVIIEVVIQSTSVTATKIKNGAEKPEQTANCSGFLNHCKMKLSDIILNGYTNMSGIIKRQM